MAGFPTDFRKTDAVLVCLGRRLQDFLGVVPVLGWTTFPVTIIDLLWHLHLNDLYSRFYGWISWITVFSCLLACSGQIQHAFHSPHSVGIVHFVHVCCLRVALAVHVYYEGGAKRLQFFTVEFPFKTWMLVTCRDLLWKPLRVLVSKMAQPCQDAAFPVRLLQCAFTRLGSLLFQVLECIWMAGFPTDFCKTDVVLVFPGRRFQVFFGVVPVLGWTTFPVLGPSALWGLHNL